MDMMFIQEVVLPIVYIVVGIALIWALVELILFLRKTSQTVSSVEEQVTPLIKDAQEMAENLKPAVEKVDPLVERVSLTVDALNLEIMQVDGILEDVSAMTDTAARTVETVDAMAQTPMRLVNQVSDKIRGAIEEQKISNESAALANGEKNVSGLAAGNPAEGDAPEAQVQAEKTAEEAAVAHADVNASAESEVKAPETQSAKPTQSKYFTYENKAQ